MYASSVSSKQRQCLIESGHMRRVLLKKFVANPTNHNQTRFDFLYCLLRRPCQLVPHIKHEPSTHRQYTNENDSIVAVHSLLPIEAYGKKDGTI